MFCYLVLNLYVHIAAHMPHGVEVYPYCQYTAYNRVLYDLFSVHACVCEPSEEM